MNFKITSLRLKDCGPFDDVLIDFTDNEGNPLDICLVAGPNGSGKTTVLRVIVELFEIAKKDGLETVELPHYIGYAQVNFLVIDEGLHIDIPFTIYMGSLPTDAVISDYFIGFERLDDFGKSKHNATYDGTSKEIHDIIRGKSSKNGLLKKDKPKLLFFPHLRSLEELIDRDQLHKENGDDKFVFRYETVRQFKGSFESYLVWLDYAKHKQYEETIQFLNELDIDGKTFFIEREELMVMVKTPKDGIHPLYELSAGEQNILIILSEIHRRLKHSSIILIDEVDNSLHPAYQIKLMNALKEIREKTDSQLFLTSHAKEVLKKVPYEGVRIFSPLLV